MVRTLSLPATLEPIAFEYLSANSHATAKSIHSVPKTANVCSLRSLAFLKGTTFRIKGKSTLSGKQPVSGPQIVIILQPFFNCENFEIILSIICSSENQKRITEASPMSDCKISSHLKDPL